MLKALQLEDVNIYAQTAVALIYCISLVHFIGFINLEKWLYFSGIGQTTERWKNNYGYYSIVLLNLSAALLFLIMPTIFTYSIQENIRLISWLLIFVFIIRGISGIILGPFISFGTATKGWELIFSSISLIIGVFMYYGVMEGTK